MTRLTAVLSLLLAAGAAAQDAGTILVLNDVNLIDGTGAAARPHARIVIRGERIEAVEDAAPAPPPAGAGFLFDQK